MRKIESQMCAAIQKNINWQSANTSVHFNEETGESIVRLHGNKIAVVSDNDMTIFDGGYQSNTTKSCLNALCDYFCVAGEGVFQKNCCLLYTSPSPRDGLLSRMPSSA